MDEKRAVDTMTRSVLHTGAVDTMTRSFPKTGGTNTMSVEELCSSIALCPQAVAYVKEVSVDEQEYSDKARLFHEDREAFFREILGMEDFRIMFLYYYLHFACDAYRNYCARGLSLEIYIDTFLDIGYWCSNCFDRYGEYGINEYEWIAKLMKPEVIRLGRLEYEAIVLEKDIRNPQLIFCKGDRVIFVHIPQGSRLDEESCDKSLQKAYLYYGEKSTFVCFSWLLYPGLMDFIPLESNIALFQKRFDIMGTDESDRQAEERVFGIVQPDPSAYIAQTALQKEMKKYLLSGKTLGCGFGILKNEKVIVTNVLYSASDIEKRLK